MALNVGPECRDVRAVLSYVTDGDVNYGQLLGVSL